MHSLQLILTNPKKHCELIQITPTTAQDFGGIDVDNPSYAIYRLARELKSCMNHCG